MSYATNTSVTEDRSRAEIEKLLMRFGADTFGYSTSRTEAMIHFTHQGFDYAFHLPLPDRKDSKFTRTPGRNTKRSEQAAFVEWSKEVRRKWRSLALVVKAMLVGVTDGVLAFEEAFMPYIIMEGGGSLYHAMLPSLEKRRALPAPKDGAE